MITPEQHAEIRRLYYGEHWTIGTIAAARGVPPDTVRAAIADTQAVRRGTCRATTLDPYLPLVRDTLAQYPRLRATRLYEMVRARGYAGSVVQLRRVVRLLRPQATPTVYRRLTTLAGEEAQVDWGAFGTIRIGHGTRPLSGFVMVLSYSRALSALFTMDRPWRVFCAGTSTRFRSWGAPRGPSSTTT
jgi:transposase